jgi:rhodanese-related sulfurtransferase
VVDNPAETEEPAEPTQEPELTEDVMEETEEPALLEPASEDQLDQAYSEFLSSMVKYNTIGVDTLAEKITEGTAPFLLDVRNLEEVEENGYIEGAVLIPLGELGDNFDKLPAFDTSSVAYCGSGWRCTIAMTGLGALGYHENILSLKDGSFGGWVDAGYPVVDGVPAEAEVLDAIDPDPSLALSLQQMFSSVPDGYGVITADDLAAALAENPDLILVDVRTASEVEENGYIEGANFIPLEEMIDMKADWPADKSAPVVIYCGSGHRSTIAMTILWTYGYSDVHSLKDGFGAWKEGGFTVVGGTATEEADVYAMLDQAYEDFLAGMVKYNTIGLNDLNLALGEEPPPYLLDVRNVDEAEENGHIEGAYLIPLRELGENYEMLPSFDTQVVSYCGSGWRCTIAMTAMGALGWEDVLSLKEDSFSGWVEAGYPLVDGTPPDNVPLNAAELDPVLGDHMAAVLAGIPDGWGGVSVDDLATELVENADIILIDVRTAEERAENGVIDYENQLAIPLEDFIAMKSDWPAELDAEIVVYCGSGHRSTMAMTILWSYGIENTRSMKGGFAEYIEAGYPIAEAVAE